MVAGGQGPLTKARTVGQLRPGVQLKAAPKGVQQLLSQRELGMDTHDPRTDEGSFEQGSCRGTGTSKLPHLVSNSRRRCHPNSTTSQPPSGSSGGQKPSSTAAPIPKSQKGLGSPTWEICHLYLLHLHAPQPDWLVLRPGSHGQQGPQSSVPIPQLAVCAIIPTGKCPRCPDLEHGAGSNPAGHPGSGTLSSWPSHPALAPSPATDRAPRCGVPWPQWAGGHLLAQPCPPLPHQARRQGVACRSSHLRQFNKTKLVTGAAEAAQGELCSPPLPPGAHRRNPHEPGTQPPPTAQVLAAPLALSRQSAGPTSQPGGSRFVQPPRSGGQLAPARLACQEGREGWWHRVLSWGWTAWVSGPDCPQ